MDADRELDDKIAELKEEFGSLLDDDALKKLALEELGRLIINKKSIVALKNREGASLTARVVRIYDTKEFKRKDGSKGKVRNILIEDDTGGCKFSLWDDDSDLPEQMGIREGSLLDLINCYVKISDYGVEVTKGRIGRIDILE